MNGYPRVVILVATLLALPALAHARSKLKPKPKAVLVALDTELRLGAVDAPTFRPVAKEAPVLQFRFVRAIGDHVEIASYPEPPAPDRCGAPAVFHPALELRFFVPAEALRQTVSAPEPVRYRDGSMVTVYPGAVLVPSGAAFTLTPAERLVETVTLRAKALTTIFTPRVLPSVSGALAGPATLAIGGKSLELADDETLPLVAQGPQKGGFQVDVRGQCVVARLRVGTMMLAGIGTGSGADGVDPRPSLVSAGEALFYEGGRPAGVVREATNGDVTLPDGRTCFDLRARVRAELSPAKLRVCTAAQ